MKKECIFCQICDGTLSSYKVWEDEGYLAFLSIFPNLDGLTVVVPKRHLSSYVFDHSMEEVSKLMSAAKWVAKILVDKFETAARVGVVFEGFGVDHLHAKLFPLHGTKGDRRSTSSSIDTKFKVYPGYISTHDAALESDEKLSAVLKLLKGD